ncbi:toxin CptA [Sulfuritortus calidifontis]|uniref:Toxin CptA n=1 Tax=Sulfuritortus calidifontis TaxID=1914471 RepID=A0A4R3JR09_9PROT|nr:protein YgfX [Sulfuritortus calidifontis]TCS69449.1 toxin CptA [Sulfuritortus calidifontis]
MNEMLSCTIRASRRLAVLALGLHGLAALGVASADIGWPLQLAGLGLVALSAILALRRRPPVRLRCLADGNLLMAEGANDWQLCEIRAGSLVSPMCTVLHLRIDGRARVVIVLADSLDGEGYRRLRVWLRWRAAWPSAPRWPVPRL